MRLNYKERRYFKNVYTIMVKKTINTYFEKMQVHVNEKCSPLHRISPNCELHMILKLTLNSDRVIFHGGWFCWILMLINNRYLDVLSKRYAGVAELGMNRVQVRKQNLFLQKIFTDLCNTKFSDLPPPRLCMWF